MRMRSSLLLAASLMTAPLAAGCGGGNHVSGTENVPGADMTAGTGGITVHPTDMGNVYTAPPLPPTGGHGDMARPPGGDDTSDGGGTPGQLGDGGVFVPPPPPDLSMPTAPPPPPPPKAPPGTLVGVTVLGQGVDFNDVSSDQGGGVWAVNAARVYYWPGGSGGPVTYDQSSGLAQGKTTWYDNYWCAGDGIPCPATWNVSFTSVAGGQPGQAVIGNIGTIADRIDVDPSSGAVRDVVGLQVTSTQQPDPTEMMEQQQRVVASWRVAVDLNGTFNGTAYLGGWHGMSAFHGLGNSKTSGICGQGCADFEEHVHPFINGGNETAGRDIRAISITPEGDLWVGDADAVWFLAQRSIGPNNDFFYPSPMIPGQNASYLDIFPGTADMVFGIAQDPAGGVWIASYTNGLAYLAPGTYAPSYWSAATTLPENRLTSVVADGGDVWIGTVRSGVARFTPASNTWTYYTTQSGLPSNDVRALSLSNRGGVRTLYIATDWGVAVYTGP
jgi:hypothetical protein